MLLYEPLPCSIEWDGQEIPLNFSFDRVLHLFDMWKDLGLTDHEKLNIALELLVDDETIARKVLRSSDGIKSALFAQIYKEYLEPEDKPSKTGPRLFDFNEDADFILASFWMDYGIDLIEAQGQLDWRKFLALFQGLSKNTKIKEVMSIRARPVPSPTKHNQEEIQQLQELKQYYALSPAENENNFDGAVERLFSTLEARVRR